MARQRCTIDAIVDAADLVTLLRSYQELAATTRDIVSTDIPRSALDDFVDLAFLVKDVDPERGLRRDPDRPGLSGLRRDAPDRPGGDRPGARRGGDAGDQPRADVRRLDEVRGPGRPAALEDPAADVGDACAYDRAQAEEALAAGKPPTRRG